jgi:hypothetical protein
MHPRVRGAELVVLLVLVVVSAAACGTTAASNRSSSVPKSGASSSGVTIDATALIDQLFVATAAQYNHARPNQWQDFLWDAQNAITYRCLLSDGFQSRQVSYLLSESPPPQPGVGEDTADNTQYPDVSRLEAGNLGISPVHAPATGVRGPSIPTAQQAAFNADMTACRAKPIPGEQQVQSELAPIFRLWNTDLSAVMTTPSVTNAIRTWSSCVAQHGDPANSLQDYFAKLDPLIQAHVSSTSGGNPYEAPDVVAQVKVYGDCIGPVASAMDTARQNDLNSLLNRYGAELTSIAGQMTKTIDGVAQKYGLQIT